MKCGTDGKISISYMLDMIYDGQKQGKYKYEKVGGGHSCPC